MLDFLRRLLPESSFHAWKRGFDQGIAIGDERVAFERENADRWKATAYRATATLAEIEKQVALLCEERNFYRDLAMLTLDISEKTLRTDE